MSEEERAMAMIRDHINSGKKLILTTVGNLKIDIPDTWAHFIWSYSPDGPFVRINHPITAIRKVTMEEAKFNWPAGLAPPTEERQYYEMALD